MNLCPNCKGKGCEPCDFEGTQSHLTFVRDKIIQKKELKYDDYQAKKQKETKFDKKNASRD